ncbi:MAG: GGDEF domain-containing protein [Pseudomonadota bacterium]
MKRQLKALRPCQADSEESANGSARKTSSSSFNFVSAPRGPENSTFEGTMTLANSQYEGEDCLQVTVKVQDTDTKSPSSAAGQPAPASGASDQLELPGFVKAVDSFFASESDTCFILVAGLDNFSNLQQAYGLVGTETICRKVWQTFSEAASEFPVTRLSHDQFALAVAAPDQDKVQEIADSIRRTMADMILEVQDKTVRPTMTLAGVPFDTDAGVSASLDSAHELLLESFEREASNTVILPQPSTDNEDIDGARVILRQITDAIDNKTFITLFQPIISLRGDSDEHYEVFLRMTGDEGEQIEPAQFLQTAIDNNVAGKIDRWVILQSIKMLSVHRAKGHATRLTINLTSNSVTDPEFLQWLAVAIKAARLPSDAVIFQITEKDATTYLRQTREFVEGLRNMHCRASLSRFGLIEDPFETLRHIPVDMVKLDGNCVAEMSDKDDSKDALIKTIQQLQNAGKLTIVPMVENANILSTLWQAGANYIQGHYLQEPSAEMDYDFSTED